MKKLRNAAFVDESVYARSNNRDKSLINTLALFVPVSSIIAGLAFYYGIVFILDSQILGIVVGFLAFFALYQHDRTLLDTYNNNKIIGRVALSVIIALVLATPYKVQVSKDSLVEKIQQENHEYNSKIDSQLMVELQYVEEQEAALNAKVTEAGKQFDRTGKAQELTEARRERKAFLEKKPAIVDDLTQMYEVRKKEPDTSNIALAGYYLNNMFDSSSPAEMFLNIFLFVTMLFVESMPAFVRLLLTGGDYLRIKEHLEQIAVKSDNKMWELDNQLLNNPNGFSHLPHILAQREVYKMLKTEAQSDFKNAEDLITLLQKANMIQKPPQKEQSPPKASKNGQASEDEFPEFEYQN